VHGGIAAKRPFEVQRRVDAAETATEDENARRDGHAALMIPGP
jgi:hypothetical protein